MRLGDLRCSSFYLIRSCRGSQTWCVTWAWTRKVPRWRKKQGPDRPSKGAAGTEARRPDHQLWSGFFLETRCLPLSFWEWDCVFQPGSPSCTCMIRKWCCHVELQRLRLFMGFVFLQQEISSFTFALLRSSVALGTLSQEHAQPSCPRAEHLHFSYLDCFPPQFCKTHTWLLRSQCTCLHCREATPTMSTKSAPALPCRSCCVTLHYLLHCTCFLSVCLHPLEYKFNGRSTLSVYSVLYSRYLDRNGERAVACVWNGWMKEGLFPPQCGVATLMTSPEHNYLLKALLPPCIVTLCLGLQHEFWRNTTIQSITCSIKFVLP